MRWMHSIYRLCMCKKTKMNINNAIVDYFSSSYALCFFQCAQLLYRCNHALCECIIIFFMLFCIWKKCENPVIKSINWFTLTILCVWCMIYYMKRIKRATQVVELSAFEHFNRFFLRLLCLCTFTIYIPIFIDWTRKPTIYTMPINNILFCSNYDLLIKYCYEFFRI